MPIRTSVGAGGENRTADVFFVQFLVADWQSRKGETPIAVDGRVGTETVAAIRAFQAEQTGAADGRVDPSGPAIERLEALHVEAMHVNEVPAYPERIPIPEVPPGRIPPEETPERYFRQFLVALRDELGRAAEPGPSPLIRDVASRASAALASGPDLPVDDGTLGVRGLSEVGRALTGGAGLSLEGASLAQGDDHVAVTGAARLLGTTPRPVTMTVRDDGGAVVSFRSEAADGPTPIAAVLGALFGGAVRIPDGFSGLDVSVLDADFRPATSSGTVRLAGQGQTRLAGLIPLRDPRVTLEVSELGGPAVALAARLNAGARVAGRNFRIDGPLGEPGAFEVTQEEGPSPTVRQLLSDLVGSAPAQLPDLALGELRASIDLDAEEFIFLVPLEGTWAVGLGLAPVELSRLVVTLMRDANGVSGRLTGRCRLGPQTVSVRASLPGEVVLEGELPPVDLSDMVNSVAGDVLRLPSGLPEFGLGASHFRMEFTGETPGLQVRSRVADFGDVLLEIVRVADRWETLAAFALASDWKFSKLAPALAPLDALPIRSPRLLLASFDSADFLVPPFGGVDFGRGVRRGVTLAADLRLDGGALGFVARLFGLESLPLGLTIEDSVDAAEVSAELAGRRELLPGTLTIDRFGLAILPSPLRFAPVAEATVVLFGHPLPKFRISAGVEIDGGTPSLTMVTSEAWVNPLGIRGLTVNALGLLLQATPPLYGVLGDVVVAGVAVKVECHFVSNAPTFLRGEIPGPLSLGQVVEDLVGLQLPALLNLSIRDFKILMVAAPTESIDGEHFDPGLALQGTLGILGLELFVKVAVRPESGVFAHGALNRMVNVANVLVVSNAGGDGPPSFTLDTTSSPFLRLSGRVSLLGLSQSIDATLDRGGFSVQLRESLGITSFDLDARFRSLNDIRARGTFRFGVDMRVGPLRLAPSTPSLGEFHVVAGFVGAIDLSLLDQTFRAALTGGFEWNGFRITLPEVTLSASPSSLADLPRLIETSLRRAVEEQLVAGVRDQIERLGQYVREQIIAGGRVLRETWSRAGEYLREQFENGRQVSRLLRKLTGELEEWVWGEDGVFRQYRRWVRSTADAAADAADLVERRLRDAAGQLEKWLWEGGAIREYNRWARSTAAGAAEAADLVERKLRDAAGQLEKWLWGPGGAIREYNKWASSTAAGAAETADLVERRLRDAAGQLEKWLWNAGGTFAEYNRWARSTAAGAAQAADLAERRLRDAAGQLQKWLWGPGGAFVEYNRWARSTAAGAAEAADLAERKLRDAAGQLQKWLWEGGALREYNRWARSTAAGAAEAIDLAERKLRSVAGQLEAWVWGPSGVFVEYNRWARSTAAGAAQATDLVERKLRNAAGQLEQWLWGGDGAFQQYRRWLRSTAGGAAEVGDLAERRLRDAAGQLEKWLWGPGGTFTEYNKWARSTAAGAAQAADLAERRLRSAAGQLEKWLWGPGGAFAEYNKWARSTAAGAAEAADLAERSLRSAAGQLEKWLWGPGGAFVEYDRWTRSTAAGAAEAVDLAERKLRSAAGQLERWLWGPGGAFVEYNRWARSTAAGAAQAADLAERKLRDAAGQLEKWLWGPDGVMLEYDKWASSTAAGAAQAADMVEKRLRNAAGQLEKWLWNGGVFSQYFRWRVSTAAGAAAAADLAMRLTQEASGQRIVEVWDEARRYGKSVFDAAGRLIPSLSIPIGGLNIPLPEWPPRF